MDLFNPMTLARHLPKVDPAPADHSDKLDAWAGMIAPKRVVSIKETALYSDFKSNIVEAVLGYTSVVTGADHTVTAEKTILRGSVDLALSHFGDEKDRISASFELKDEKTKDLDAIMLVRAMTPVQ